MIARDADSSFCVIARDANSSFCVNAIDDDSSFLFIALSRSARDADRFLDETRSVG